MLYRFARSGHSHRAELFLSLLGLPVTPVDVDLAGGQHKTPEYLAMNCFGQVPVIRDGDVTVADSNAILCYLASRYGAEHWLPREPAQAAQVLRLGGVQAGQKRVVRQRGLPQRIGNVALGHQRGQRGAAGQALEGLP